MTTKQETEKDCGTWPTASLPLHWSWAPFDVVLANETTSDRKLAQKDYQADGQLAVVDQGQSLIAGYTSELRLQHPAPPPVIVFGDHTRCLKFVDFPFVQGADGVKVLRARQAYDSDFAFHALRTVVLPDRGYARHYKFLTATQFPVPPVAEQRRIVAKLEALQSRSRRAREALGAVPPLLEKLRQSILAAAFRGDLTKDWRAQNPNPEPASALLARIRTERRKKWEEAGLAKLTAKGKAPTDDRWKAKYKEPEAVDTTELPELPTGWCWATWGEVGFCQNGRAFPSSEYAASGMKLLRPGNLHVFGQLEWTDSNTRCMPPKWAEEFPDFVVGADELLMNLTAQSLKDEFLGRVCLSDAGEECLLNQRIGRLTPVLLPPRYWLYFFKSPSFRQYVDTLNTGSLIQHMFTSQVDTCAVPLMPLDEAKQVVHIIEGKLATIRSQGDVVSRHGNLLPCLDRSILAKAFRGELVPQDPNDEPAEIMLSRLRADAPAEPPRQRPRRAKAAE